MDNGSTWRNDVWAAFLHDGVLRITQKHRDTSEFLVRYTSTEKRSYQAKWKITNEKSKSFRVAIMMQRLACKLGMHVFYVTIEEATFTHPWREMRTFYKVCDFCGKRVDTGESVSNQYPERRRMRLYFDNVDDKPIAFQWRNFDGSFEPIVKLTSTNELKDTDLAHVEPVINRLASKMNEGIEE